MRHSLCHIRDLPQEAGVANPPGICGASEYVSKSLWTIAPFSGMFVFAISLTNLTIGIKILIWLISYELDSSCPGRDRRIRQASGGEVVVTQITRNISGDGISIYRRGDAVPRMMKIRIYITASTRSGRDRIVSLANNPGLAGSHPQQLPASPHGPQTPLCPRKSAHLSPDPRRGESGVVVSVPGNVPDRETVSSMAEIST